MEPHYKQALAHVLWLGGGTDAGKTTIAEAIANRYGSSTITLTAMRSLTWSGAKPPVIMLAANMCST